MKSSKFSNKHLRNYPRQSEIRRGRFILAVLCFTAGFGTIAVRLVDLGLEQANSFSKAIIEPLVDSRPRPDVVDRHGTLLATDIMTASLFADPARLVDVDEAAEELTRIFPELSLAVLRRKIGDRTKRFVWIKRGLSPRQQELVHNLGLAGLDFVPEPRRIYPADETASHILGTVNIDNRGSSGIERYIDSVSGLYLPRNIHLHDKPVVQLSIDLGVQHVLRRELKMAQVKYRSKAAAGLVLDVTSGEILAMSSLPDFDPHRREQALEPQRFDRNTMGTFELGSVFKTITVAMALELETATLDKKFDAREPIKAGIYEINDYHGQNRELTLEEVFIYSSNIGAAKMALEVGERDHLSFLKRLGLTTAMTTEIGQLKTPVLPKYWTDLHSMTIAYGHGISIAPLQFAASIATLVNGGFRVNPTFLKKEDERIQSQQDKVIKSETSHIVRNLLKLNVEVGTGKLAAATGYRVGGKTGTADKPVGGGYSKNAVLSSFVAVFPIDDPAYVVFIMLDEPKSLPGSHLRPTAGTNAAPTTRRIIARIAPMLGIAPKVRSSALIDEDEGATY